MDFFGAAAADDSDSDHETDTIDEVLTTAVFVECMKIKVCLSSLIYNIPFALLIFTPHCHSYMTHTSRIKREKNKETKRSSQ